MPPGVAVACAIPSSFACSSWHMSQKTKRDAYNNALRGSSFDPYGYKGETLSIVVLMCCNWHSLLCLNLECACSKKPGISITPLLISSCIHFF